MENIADSSDADEGSEQSSAALRGILYRALDLIRGDFEETTWQAFWLTTAESKLPSDVAEQLHVSVNAVYKAKSRVLRRIRDELSGLELEQLR